jgi:hypothetical protein
MNDTFILLRSAATLSVHHPVLYAVTEELPLPLLSLASGDSSTRPCFTEVLEIMQRDFGNQLDPFREAVPTRCVNSRVCLYSQFFE